MARLTAFSSLTNAIRSSDVPPPDLATLVRRSAARMVRSTADRMASDRVGVRFWTPIAVMYSIRSLSRRVLDEGGRLAPFVGGDAGVGHLMAPSLMVVWSTRLHPLVRVCVGLLVAGTGGHAVDDGEVIECGGQLPDIHLAACQCVLDGYDLVLIEIFGDTLQATWALAVVARSTAPPARYILWAAARRPVPPGIEIGLIGFCGLALVFGNPTGDKELPDRIKVPTDYDRPVGFWTIDFDELVVLLSQGSPPAATDAGLLMGTAMAALRWMLCLSGAIRQGLAGWELVEESEGLKIRTLYPSHSFISKLGGRING
jgi:hypothetical protein